MARWVVSGLSAYPFIPVFPPLRHPARPYTP
jgi:hypothetical protein